MFAENFKEPVKDYIKDKNGKEVPLPFLNKCGMLVYGLAFAVWISCLLSYMLAPSFRLTTSTIEMAPIEGQSCDVMTAYTGPKTVVTMTSAMKSEDVANLNACFMSPHVTSKALTPEDRSSCPAQADYSNGPQITNTFVDVSMYANLCDPSKGSSPAAKAILEKAKPLLRSFGCGLPYSGYFGSQGFFDAYGVFSLPSILDWTPMTVSFQSVYFSNHTSCVSVTQKYGTKITRAEKEYSPDKVVKGLSKVFNTGTADKYCGVASLPSASDTQNGDGLSDCRPTVDTAYFSVLSATEGLTLARSDDSNGQFSNLICDKMTNPAKQGDYDEGCAQTCGITPEKACPNFDAAKLKQVYDLLYPDLAQQVCKPWEKLPPYSCSSTRSPSFFEALGNSLAFLNTFLTVAFAVAFYMVSHDIDITGYFFKDKAKAAVEASDAKKADDITPFKPVAP